MRQRTIKNLDEKLELNSSFLIKDPRECKGCWNKVFGNDNPIYLEVGCGKGQFIFKHATSSPDKNFIAVEGQSSVALRVLEKAEENKQENLRVFIDFVNDLIRQAMIFSLFFYGQAADLKGMIVHIIPFHVFSSFIKRFF